MKQSDLAIHGMSSALISLYEADRRSPSYEMVQALAERLGVSVSVFFPGCDDESHQQILMTLITQAERAERRHAWQEALDCWQSAYVICQSHHIADYAYRILQHKGMAIAELQHWQESLDMLLGLLVHPQFAKDLDNAYTVLWYLGKCSRELGHWEQANTFAKLALTIVSPSDERSIRMHINIGSGALHIGDWEKAIESNRIAIAAAAEMGSGDLEAWGHIGLTSAYLNQGKTEDVESHLNRAQKLAVLLDNHALITAVQHNFMVFHRITGNVAAAKELAVTLSASDNLTQQNKAELLHEKLLLAASTADRDLGEQSLRELKSLEGVSGTMRGLLWLGAVEYFVSSMQFEQATQFLRLAQNSLNISRYHDSSVIIRLNNAITERGEYDE